jgi:hypothetical protein
MSPYPIVDESLDRLHRAGWRVGDAASGSGQALVWGVSGGNGKDVMKVFGVLGQLPGRFE